jgi:hypothetical protein
MEIIFDSRTVLACNTQLTDGLDLLDAAGVFLIKSIEPAMTLATAKHRPEEKKCGCMIFKTASTDNPLEIRWKLVVGFVRGIKASPNFGTSHLPQMVHAAVLLNA